MLQDAQFTKLGSNKPINVDVRVVAATNRDLEAMMLRGEFREDLYYRLKVIEATVPPLRERRDEIPHLTDFFIDRYAQRYNRPVRQLSDELAAALPDLRVAGQHPRAREHDQAHRDPAGRAAGHARDVARAAHRIAGVRRAPASARTGRRAAAVADEPRRARSDDEDEVAGAPRPPVGRRRPARGLPTSRKAAALKAERAIIEDTLHAGALEPPPRRRAARRQLQDAAQQDQGVRHQPRKLS